MLDFHSSDSIELDLESYQNDNNYFYKLKNPEHKDVFLNETTIKQYQKIIDLYSNKSDKIICNNCFYTPILSLKFNSTEYLIKWNCKCGNKILNPIEFINLIKTTFNNVKCSKCSINYNYSKLIKCVECDLILCDSCNKIHKQNILKKKENPHLTIKLEDIYHKCKVHPNLKPNGYCVICKENICNKCFELHKFHNVFKYEDFKITKKIYDTINKGYQTQKQQFFKIFFTRERYYKSFTENLEMLLQHLRKSFEQFKENHFSFLGVYETIIDSNKNFFENFYYEKQMNLINLASIKVIAPPQLSAFKDTVDKINDYINKLRNIFNQNYDNYIKFQPYKHIIDSNYRLYPLKEGNIICYNSNYMKIIKGKYNFDDIFIFPPQENIVKVYQIQNGNIAIFSNFHGQLLYSFYLKIDNNNYKDVIGFKYLIISQIETNYENLFLFRNNFEIQISEISDNYIPLLKTNFNIWNNDFSNYYIKKIKFIDKINIIVLLNHNYSNLSIIILYNINLKKIIKKQIFNNRYSFFYIKNSKTIILGNIIFNLLTWQIELILKNYCIGLLSNGNFILNDYNYLIVYNGDDYKPIMKFKNIDQSEIDEIFLLNGLIIYKTDIPIIFYIRYSPQKQLLYLN